MIDRHEPRSEFVHHLAWLVEGEARRRREAGGVSLSPGRCRQWLFLRTAALIVLSVAGGAFSVMASEHFQVERRRELLLARARVHEEMAQRRLQRAQESFDETLVLQERGMVSSSELRREEQQLVHLQCETERLHLDLQEIDGSGREPDHAISAALVKGRDLVRERLVLDRRSLAGELQCLQDEFARARALKGQGLVSTAEISEVEGRLTRIQGQIDLLERQLVLREEFVSGKETALRVELRAALLQAEQTQKTQQHLHELAQDKLQQARQAQEAGVLGRRGMRAAEEEVSLTEFNVQLVQIEIELLRDQLSMADQSSD